MVLARVGRTALMLATSKRSGLRERLTRALCEDQHCDNSKADLANFLPS